MLGPILNPYLGLESCGSASHLFFPDCFTNLSLITLQIKKNLGKPLQGSGVRKSPLLSHFLLFILLKVKEVEIGKPSPEKFQVHLSVPELAVREILFWISISHSKEYATAFCVAEVLMKENDLSHNLLS